MLTAHKRLATDVSLSQPYQERGGWEILDDDLNVLALVMTKREAAEIVRTQKLPTPARCSDG